MRYPVARRQRLVEDLHGNLVADPYRWLEDPHSAETRRWLAEEDALARRELDQQPGRARVEARLRELGQRGWAGAPLTYGTRTFLRRRLAGEETPRIFVREQDGSERQILDPVAFAGDDTASVVTWTASPDGSRLAFALTRGGDEETSVYVMDVATGAILDGPIDRTRNGSLQFIGNDELILGRRLAPELVPKGEAMFHRRVYRHRIGSDTATDIEIWGTGRPKTEFMSARLYQKRWLLVSTSSDNTRYGLYMRDLKNDGPWVTLAEGGKETTTSGSVGRDGRLYLLTQDGSPTGRLMVCDPRLPDRSKWQELIAAGPNPLDGYVVTANYLYVKTEVDGAGRIAIHDRITGRYIRDVPLPGRGDPSLQSAPGKNTDDVHISYHDYTTPLRCYRFHPDDDSLTIVTEPPGEVRLPSNMTATSVEYPSKDGTMVPMTVVHRTDVVLDGTNPTILNGYGGFNISQTPGFSDEIATWVEAGGVYAVANLRGGGERGEDWHTAGKRENKQNVFDDFIAASEWLIARGYTSPKHLGISGGSNGGLLVTAVMTQRPELFAAVDCAVPLCDMVRYEKFGIGRIWNGEYGSADSPEEIKWLLSYSPYHHLRPGVKYPAVIFTSGDADGRTDPLHARKMCAALQWATRGGRVLLRRERRGGHVGRSQSQRVAEQVDTLTFMAAELGLDLGTPQVQRVRELPRAPKGHDRGIEGLAA